MEALNVSFNIDFTQVIYVICLKKGNYLNWAEKKVWYYSSYGALSLGFFGTSKPL